MTHLRRALLACALSFGFAATAGASSITFTFAGHLTEINTSPSQVQGNFLNFAVGNTFTATAIFESTLLDGNGDSRIGRYQSDDSAAVPHPFQLSIKGLDFGSPYMVQEIDDNLYPDSDQYNLGILTTACSLCPPAILPANVFSFGIGLALASSNDTLFTTDALITTPFPVASADILNHFTLTYAWNNPSANGSYPIGQVFGVIDTWSVGDAALTETPEPITLTTFGFGLLSVYAARRRRK